MPCSKKEAKHYSSDSFGKHVSGAAACLRDGLRAGTNTAATTPCPAAPAVGASPQVSQCQLYFRRPPKASPPKTRWTPEVSQQVCSHCPLTSHASARTPMGPPVEKARPGEAEMTCHHSRTSGTERERLPTAASSPNTARLGGSTPSEVPSPHLTETDLFAHCFGRRLDWVTHRGPIQPPTFCD